MKASLIDNIYTRLNNANPNKLPFALKGGQMGLCIFMALYSKQKVNNEAWKLSTYLLAECIKNIKRTRNIRLLDGNMGTAWGIRYLAQQDFLEEDEKLNNLYQSISDTSEYYGTQGPIYIIDGEPLFSGGIYLAQLYVQEETLARYFREERLIGLIDYCEKMMTVNIKGIYTPYDMPLSMLHSILFFLQRMDQEQIFPFLVRDLLQNISGLYRNIKKGNVRDEYIYHFLRNEKYVFPDNRLNVYSLVELIGDIGFYSLLYNRPRLFKSFWEQLEAENPIGLLKAHNAVMEEKVSIDTLCGWGYGLLCNKIE